ncbi:MAG: hypothetical protein A2X30_04715 [Elusimicrobia bacterium GWB2_63_16]|nr:MAG: hypothetical protein A2X30_04715 [Elusimicrobia bacterium GWB2_63_16]
MMMNSSAFTFTDFRPILISASPSSISAIASKGAVCSLKPCPLSNEKRVTVPTGFRMIVRLTTAPAS